MTTPFVLGVKAVRIISSRNEGEGKHVGMRRHDDQRRESQFFQSHDEGKYGEISSCVVSKCTTEQNEIILFF